MYWDSCTRNVFIHLREYQIHGLSTTLEALLADMAGFSLPHLDIICLEQLPCLHIPDLRVYSSPNGSELVDSRQATQNFRVVTVMNINMPMAGSISPGAWMLISYIYVDIRVHLTASSSADIPRAYSGYVIDTPISRCLA